VLLLLGAIFAAGLVVLLVSFYRNAETYVMKPVNGHLYSSGVLTGGGNVVDRNGVILSKSGDGERVYNSASAIRKALLHTIGDDHGFIATGVQKTFSSELVGYSVFWGVNTSKTGKGNSLKLTLDANVCAAAYEALTGRKGTVGVYNYKTGEMICMVSTPSFDVNSKPADIAADTSGKYDGVYVNKLLNGLYVPGSVFKVVTAVCALENIPNIRSRAFECTGELKTRGGTVICSEVHGTVTFDQALKYSCNSAFAQIAIELGASRLNSTAKRLGLTSSFTVDRVNTATGIFDVSGTTDADLGWAGIGQYTTMANPFAIMTMMGAVANGGTPVQPYFVESVTNSAGMRTYRGGGDKLSNYMGLTTANALQSILRDTVKTYYGESGLEGLEICAKTGTAEVGKDKTPHAWFAGFSQKSDFPYAFVVVVENGGGGYRAAAPVAAKVLRAISK
jgi:peptidoglycan glycosyltransferase